MTDPMIIPKFPANYGWVTSATHQFKPREVTDAIKQLQAETLLGGDTHFRQLLRQCKNFWYVAVTVGYDTLNLYVYDPVEVDSPTRKPCSSSVNAPRTHFITVNRNGDIRSCEEDVIKRLLTTAPKLYAVRNLQRDEVHFCNMAERSMMNGGLPSITPDPAPFGNNPCAEIPLPRTYSTLPWPQYEDSDLEPVVSLES